MPRMSTYDKRKRTARRGSRNRSKRPKTFVSEEAAKRYAEAQSLKNYKLVNISPSQNKQKIKIVLE